MHRKLPRINALLAIVVLSALALLALETFSLDVPILSIALGAVVPLYLVGYAILCAIQPDHDESIVNLIAIPIGLSLSVGAMCAFLLSLVLVPINGFSISAFYALVVCIVCGIAVVRPPRTAYALQRHLSPPWDGASILFPAVVVSVSAGLIISAVTSKETFNDPPFTQMWMVYGESSEISMGIANYEGVGQVYDLELSLSGERMLVWQKISLLPGETWEAVLPLTDTESWEGQLVAALYLEEQPGTTEPYRQTHIWLEK